MNTKSRSHVCIVYGYSQEFRLNDGVHHGSVLSPLLFIIVLEALSRVLRSGAPGRIYMQIILSSLLNHWRNMSGGS